MSRESDVRLRRVGAVGLGHRARQDFVRGMHRHVALSRGFRHGTLLQSTVTGHCHWILPQDTITGYRHRAPVTGYQSQGDQSQDTGTEYRHGSLLRRSLPQHNITAAYKQRHPG